MNEEETSDAYKLGVKEYPTPTQALLKFAVSEKMHTEKIFGATNYFWSSLAQETLSPPPEYIF